MEYHSDQLSRSAMRAAGAARRAFTLIELMLVLAIIVVVTAFALPAVNSMFMASRLSSGADLTVNQLVLARQSAIALNRSVEVRFYRFALAGFPGELETDAATGKFRAFQVFKYDDGGQAVALTKMERLPDGILFDSGAALSTVLGPSPSSPSTPALAKKFSDPPDLRDPKIALPGCGLNYSCVAYRIFPGGGTTLASGQSFLTLHSHNGGDALTAAPANYATIQIDPASGTVRLYRP
jgi:uncharacterized protein (TIGR02596 family)